MKWLPGVLALAIGLAVLPAATAGAGDIPVEIQMAVQAARDRVLPCLVRVQPISELYLGGRKVKRSGYGSGVIFTHEGHVLTNYHVAGRAKSLLCVMADKEEIPATLIAGDPWTDLAVIKLDLTRYKGHALQWAVLGDSNKLEVGEFVIALGSPYALTRTLTFGVVSCKDRSLGVRVDLPGEMGLQETGQFNTWIQVDALINPGNSGGPLINMQGEVVGINARGGAGMGFAIPMNVAKDVAAELIEYGKVRRSWLGVEFPALAKFADRFVGDAAEGGVLVGNVVADSPAAKADIRPGDVMLTFDGKPTHARFDEQIYPIARMVARTEIGKTVEVTVLRRKKHVTLRVTTQDLGRAVGEDFVCEAWGLTVKDITPSMARMLALDDDRGVLATGSLSDSVAAKAKIGDRDVIRVIDGTEVRDLDHFKEIYEKLTAERARKVILKVLQGGRTPRLLVMDLTEAEKGPAKTAEGSGE
jgi:serine protease Do